MKTMRWMHICSPQIYEFDGWIFEYNGHTSPWPLKKDGEPRARAGKVFWAVYQRWYEMDSRARETYRVGGGCQGFHTKETKK